MPTKIKLCIDKTRINPIPNQEPCWWIPETDSKSRRKTKARMVNYRALTYKNYRI